MPDVLSVILRAVSLVLQLQAAGVAIFLAIFGPRLSDSLPAVRRFGALSALAALGLVVAHQLLEGARMADDMSGMIDPALQMIAVRSSAGTALGMRLVGLALVAFALFDRSGQPLRGGVLTVALAGAGLCLLAFLATGHTSTSPHRPVSAALLGVHLLIAAFWLGSLWPLYFASLRETPAAASRVVEAFSSVAVWVVPCIALAGGALAILLVPGLAVLSQPYGRLLLTKAGLFTVLLMLGALNKWLFGRQVAVEQRGAELFRRTVAIEYALMCAVLAATAVMTTFYSPESI